ncbi:MAG: hypothetical protein V5804_12935 [Mucilaginibacter sp.]|uniref:hypothetical protein n=1 Tax=Mucilaginibacter sp. TaxID=1882438 RepID=UPI0034E50021
MPEVIIKYEDPKTLKVLEDLSKTMNFEIETFNEENTERQKAIDAIAVQADKNADISQSVSPNQKSEKEYSINGVTMIAGDPSVDITELIEVFTGLNLDAKKLREAWKRPR